MDAHVLQLIVHFTPDARSLAALACTCSQLRGLVVDEVRQRGELA